MDLPSGSSAVYVMSGFATPGELPTTAGSVTPPNCASSCLMAVWKRLYAEMPASLEVVAPSSYLPNTATTCSTSSSQTLSYSGYLPVVLIELIDTVAVVRMMSASANVQPERRGR